ncbi:DUF998 domain-containing protein [Nocardiopsis aegyptia]|uniref:Putative membrane protein n=1 Tax=Nocardiopsis aegyptia TaxID=220378 RepID=A0A7Z0EJP8_9ACTN|nr:DUF998 domain-containing protein [Nocardiopsis aegyptia]NYJ33367.1 putative membrane protein [Nocardiopsis aegyptia]
MTPFPSTRTLLACGFAVPLFVVVILAEGALRPDYEPLHRFGSELALGPRGWIQTANFVLTGLAILAFSVGLRRAMPSGRGALAVPSLTAVVGVCAIVGGAFPVDPDGARTAAGAIHGANVVPFHLALCAAAAIMAGRLAAEPRGRPWAWYCAATALATPATIAVALALADTGAFHGLWQRIGLTTGLGWCAAMAWYLLRSDGRAARATRQGDGRNPPAVLG